MNKHTTRGNEEFLRLNGAGYREEIFLKRAIVSPQAGFRDLQILLNYYNFHPA